VHAVTEFGGMELYFCLFSISTLVGGEWPSSRPGRFYTLQKIVLGSHWKAVSVGNSLCS